MSKRKASGQIRSRRRGRKEIKERREGRKAEVEASKIKRARCDWSQQLKAKRKRSLARFVFPRVSKSSFIHSLLFFGKRRSSSLSLYLRRWLKRANRGKNAKEPKREGKRSASDAWVLGAEIKILYLLAARRVRTPFCQLHQPGFMRFWEAATARRRK